MRDISRSTDRIADGDRIAPVQYQCCVVQHSTTAERSSCSAITDLERSSRDARCPRVGVLPRQDRRSGAQQGQAQRIGSTIRIGEDTPVGEGRSRGVDPERGSVHEAAIRAAELGKLSEIVSREGIGTPDGEGRRRIACHRQVRPSPGVGIPAVECAGTSELQRPG